MTLLARLGGLTTSGRARVAVAWSLYDFANTIFSFAVVSSAIGLWLIDDSRFGERDGNFILSVAIVVSVGLNALVSPILGALSDRGGRIEEDLRRAQHVRANPFPRGRRRNLVTDREVEPTGNQRFDELWQRLLHHLDGAAARVIERRGQQVVDQRLR